MMPFDLNKCQKNEQGHWLAQTRDGRKVVIVCANAPGSLALVGFHGEVNTLDRWYADGSYIQGHAHPADVINARRRAKKGWRKVHELKMEWME
jgi:hypothetical protein